MPVRILMTTGRGVDPASLTPIPPNAHVEHWWPQADALSHTSAVIGHGGFGTTMMTLVAGVPQIIVPLFALDQTINAERVAKIGAGLHLVGGPDAVAADPRRPRASPRPSGISPTGWRVALDMADLPSGRRVSSDPPGDGWADRRLVTGEW